MEIKVRKLTNFTLMQRACEMTMQGNKSSVSLDMIYSCEHSPMRTQVFWIEMLGIPSFVSTHLVRHNIGVEHFVQSNRDDRNGGNKEITRDTPVNHGMFINAQALINMARKRLCMKSHKVTFQIMTHLVNAIGDHDPALAMFLVPECEYRGGVCHELKSCGRFDNARV